MKTLTVEKVKELGACREAVEWGEKKYGSKEVKELTVLRALIKAEREDWANWLIVRLMNYEQYVSYAVYAAEQVIKIYEEKYPEDDRPRKAIEAAKVCIKAPTDTNKRAAAAAAAAAAFAAAAFAADAATAADAAFAKQKMRRKILRYGIKLLSEDETKGH